MAHVKSEHDPLEIFNLYVTDIYNILDDEYDRLQQTPMFHSDFSVITDTFYQKKALIDEAVNCVINHKTVITCRYDLYNSIHLSKLNYAIETNEDWAVIFSTLQHILLWIIRTTTEQIHSPRNSRYLTIKCSKLRPSDCQAPCRVEKKRFQKKCVYDETGNFA